jgi:hypothetical protein
MIARKLQDRDLLHFLCTLPAKLDPFLLYRGIFWLLHIVKHFQRPPGVTFRRGYKTCTFPYLMPLAL